MTVQLQDQAERLLWAGVYVAEYDRFASGREARGQIRFNDGECRHFARERADLALLDLRARTIEPEGETEA